MIIYKVTNLLDGKVYIGLTTKTLEERIKSHLGSKGQKGIFGKALQKYGIANFQAEEIDKAETFDELVEKELQWIFHYNSQRPNGYNIKIIRQPKYVPRKDLNTYKIICPEGNVYETGNLGRFAKEFGLDYSDFYKVARGTRNKYKGWDVVSVNGIPVVKTCLKSRGAVWDNPEYRKKMQSVRKREKEYIVITPNNEKIEVYNLAEFCRLHKLDKSNLVKVARGKLGQYKGWKCIDPSLNDNNN